MHYIVYAYKYIYIHIFFWNYHQTVGIAPTTWRYLIWPWGFPEISWWRHQMETFSALLAICAGNSPVPGEFPTQRPVTRSFDVYFDLRPNKRLSKQSWGWWFETQSRPLWRHRNAHGTSSVIKINMRGIRSTQMTKYWSWDSHIKLYVYGNKVPIRVDLIDVWIPCNIVKHHHITSTLKCLLRGKYHWTMEYI